MAAPTIKTGLDTTNPMSFAKTRHGYLIGVNGINRGIFWDGRSSASNELGIDPPSTPPVMLTPKVEKQAAASILIGTGTASSLNNKYILVKDGFGKTVKYIFRNDSNYTGVVGGRFKSTYSETDANYPGGEAYVDLHGITASAASFAEYLLTTIIGQYGHDGSITASRDTATLTLTQTHGGTAGNNTVTDDSADITVSGFTGGESTGRSGFAEVTATDGDAAHGLTAGQKITLTSTDGTIIDYFVSDTGDGGVAHLSAVTAGATLKSTGLLQQP